MYAIPIVLLILAAIVLGVWQFRIRQLRRSFEGIQRSWQQALESNGITESAEWTSVPPFLAAVEGKVFMLKQVKAWDRTIDVVVDGKTYPMKRESMGYAVAVRKSNGRWEPTGMLLNAFRNQDAVSELNKLIRDCLEGRDTTGGSPGR